MNNFIGTGVAVVTPFTPDKAVDEATLRQILRHLVGGKVEYLVALGTTAESATLSEEEQIQVLDIFYSEVADHIPIVIGAGGNDTKKVCKWIEKLEDRYEAAAYLSVCPYYNKPNQQGLYQHFKTIADSTDRPIILYNVPGRTASNLSAEMTLKLANICTNVRAIKEASGDLAQIMEIIKHKPEGFDVLSGDDWLSLPMIASGAVGTISVIANAFPLPFSQMIRAALSNDWATARQIHYRLMRLTQLIFKEGNPVGVKELMRQMNLCGQTVRLPLVEASPTLQQELSTSLKELESVSIVN